MPKFKTSKIEAEKTNKIPIWLIACLVAVVILIIITSIIVLIIWAVYKSDIWKENVATNTPSAINNIPAVNVTEEKQAAEATVRSFAQAIINLDMVAMQTYCTENFKNSEFIKTLLAGTEIYWGSIEIISSYKNAQGQYDIRAAVTTIASEEMGPSQTLMQNYLVVKVGDRWLIDSLN